MTDEELQEVADIYGLYTKEDVKNRLRYETAAFQRRIDMIQGFLDRDEEYIKLKTELKKETAELKVKLDMTTDIIKKLLEDVHIAENLFNFTSRSAIKAERFLEGLEK